MCVYTWGHKNDPGLFLSTFLKYNLSKYKLRFLMEFVLFSEPNTNKVLTVLTENVTEEEMSPNK